MITLRSLVILLGLTGLASSITETVPKHQQGFPEYDYEEYPNYDGNYDDEGKIDYGDPPSFSVSSQTFTVKEGDPVTMPCTPADDAHLTDDSHYTLIIKKTKGPNEGSDKTLFLGTSKVVKDSRIKLNGGKLEIFKLRRRDAGVYVCYFDNPTVVEIRHTLVVQYPTRTTRLSDSIKTAGIKSNHEFRCEAEGNPVPTITWSRAGGGEMPTSSVIKDDDVIDTRMINKKFPQRKQSTLNLVVSDRHAEGTYICSAENSVGRPSNVNMTLRVTYPPEIIMNQSIVNSGVGDSVRLDCLVYGRPKPKVTWTHNEHTKILVSEKPNEGGHKFSTNIDSIKSKDLGDYVCDAINNIGKAQETIKITDEPSAPSFTSDPNGGEDTSYVLTWDARSYYNISKYTIKCREWQKDATEPSSPDLWQDNLNYKAGSADIDTKDDLTTFKVTLSQLEPATDYECNVRISNDQKWGPGAHYVFSTKRNQVASQTTADGTRISSCGLSAIISLLFILRI